MAVRRSPLVGVGPRGVAAFGQWERRRAEPQDVQQQRLVVAFPAVLQKAALGLPAVDDGGAAVLRPLPVGPAIEPVGKAPNVALIGRVCVEVAPGRQRAGQEHGAIHRRELATPGAPAAHQIQKMIVEAAIPGRIRLRALWARPKETECRKCAFQRCGTRHESPLDADRVRRQRESDGRDTGRPIRRVLVDDEPVGGIGLVHEIAERDALQPFQSCVVSPHPTVTAHGRIQSDRASARSLIRAWLIQRCSPVSQRPFILGVHAPGEDRN